jgi:hypothetical protein
MVFREKTRTFDKKHSFAGVLRESIRLHKCTFLFGTVS